MAITVLNDVIISDDVLAAGIKGKQMRRNSRVEVSSGAQFINQVWSQTLRQYEVGFVPMVRESWEHLESLYEVTEGGAKGFLLADPKDSSATVASGVATSLTATTFQLHKRYTEQVSSRTKDRKITRPKASGFAIYNSGVAIAPANYTLDDTTGIVTIPSGPTASNLTWSGQFYVPVHFVEDNLDWEMVISGSEHRRFYAGPVCLLQEIRE